MLYSIILYSSGMQRVVQSREPTMIEARKLGAHENKVTVGSHPQCSCKHI